MTDKEQKYLKAKEAYYSGFPVMSDEQFDKLEAELIVIKSKVVDIVGFDVNVSSTKQKIAHESRMLSLSKIKAKKNTEPPIDEFLKWLNKSNATDFSIEPKYDGNACNVIYKNGKLFKALTRGDGDFGIDITHVIKYHVPEKIDDTRTIEIRGEVLIKKIIFNKKYSQYKNPRNYVAGILHRDDVNVKEIKDLTFIPFEVKIHSGKKVFYADTISWLKSKKFAILPFNYKTLYNGNKLNKETLFINDFNYMLNYRDNESEYLLDGFVIKVLDNDLRLKLGENSHDPDWAIAIKFEAKGTVAVVDHIEWRLSRKSELIPIAILEPVELEGTTVQRVSLYNYKFCYEHFKDGVHGAEVELIKAGDIIPCITKVVTSPKSGDSWIPNYCPACGGSIKIEDVHIVCINKDCTAAELKKFIFGVKQLGMDFFGEKTLEKIYESGIKNPLDILSIDMSYMINHGFSDGKSSLRLIEQIKSVKEISLDQVFLTLGIDNLGQTLAKQLAKWYSNSCNYDFKGLQKNIVQMFYSRQGEAYDRLQSSLDRLNSLGINIILPKNDVDSDNSFYIEATGSPKNDGFDTKEDFFKYASKFGFVHAPLSKDSKYLLTDSYISTSSKMNKANKLNVEIITFKDFLKRYK